ncbi:T9SS type A sorting domain-containing protein, partial [bacterium]|nr:T9SS type A sorting domain-containing protein [bacterium]
ILMLLFFIELAGASRESISDQFLEFYRELKPNATKSSESFEEATYFSGYSFFQSGPAGGYLPFVVDAVKPGGESDSLYYGTADLVIVEENPNNSATLFSFSPTGIIPIEEIPIAEGEAFVFIHNTEPEWLLISIHSVGDTLKPSNAIPLRFVEQGTLATQVIIRGTAKGHINDPYRMFTVEIVDDDSNVVPGYGLESETNPVLYDAVTAQVLFESIPNYSVYLYSLFGGEPGTAILLPIISGMSLFMVSNIETESVQFQALSTPSDSSLLLEHSEPFPFEFVSMEVGTDLVLLSFNGQRGTAGHTKSLISMVLSSRGPDISNNSTEVMVDVIDLTGDLSVTIDPTDWQRLSAGMANFTVTNPEPDSSGIIFLPSTRGEPYLGTPFYYILYYYPPGRATKLDLHLPLIALTGDSIIVEISAVDFGFNLDSNYTGYVELKVTENIPNGSATLYDPVSDHSWNCLETYYIRLINGKADIFLTDSEEERLSIRVADVENIGMFDQGNLAESDEFLVNFVEGSGSPATNYQFVYPEERYFITDYWYDLSITAIDIATYGIDPAYSGEVNIFVDGSAELLPPGGNVLINEGIGHFSLRATDDGLLTISATGDLVPPENLHLQFLSPDSGGIIYVMLFEEPIVFVNQAFEIPILILDPYGELNASWSGYLSMAVSESNPNGSFYYPLGENPDSIEIINGRGSISISDSEPEDFLMTITGPESFIPWVTPARIYAALVVLFPDTIRGSDSMYFFLVDADTELVDFSTTLEVYAYEEFDDSSLRINPSPVIDLGRGYAAVELSNTLPLGESEYVDFYITCEDSNLLLNFDEPFYFPTFFATIQFEFLDHITGSTLKPMITEIQSVYPNPFNSTNKIKISLAEGADVSLDVFDILGKHLHTLYNGYLSPGYYKFFWDGNSPNSQSQPSGIYFYRFQAGNYEKITKVLLLK